MNALSHFLFCLIVFFTLFTSHGCKSKKEAGDQSSAFNSTEKKQRVSKVRLKFDTIHLPDSSAINRSQLVHIEADSTGMFWIGTSKQGLFCTDRSGKRYSRLDHLGINGSYAGPLLMDSKHRLWFDYSDNEHKKYGLYCIFHDSLTHFTKADYPDAPFPIYALAEGSDGAMFLGGDNGVSTLREDQFEHVHFPLEDLYQYTVYSLIESMDSSILVGSGPGFYRYASGKLTKVVEDVTPAIRAMKYDREGLLYMGLEGDGFATLSPKGEWTFYGLPKTNLFMGGVRNFEFDRFGNVWIPTGNGVVVKTDNGFSRALNLKFPGNNPVMDLALCEDTLWAITWHGIFETIVKPKYK